MVVVAVVAVGVVTVVVVAVVVAVVGVVTAVVAAWFSPQFVPRVSFLAVDWSLQQPCSVVLHAVVAAVVVAVVGVVAVVAVVVVDDTIVTHDIWPPEGWC